MKEISALNLPAADRYTATHEWARQQGDEVVIGITDYAQDQLGDIVFVELPRVGSRFAAGDEFGAVESVKAASGIYLPVAGTVTAVNESLAGAPELVNEAAADAGWMLRIKPDDTAALATLLDKDAYLASLQG